MKIQPIFKGKVKVTAVKDEKWSWYDYKTSSKADKEILNIVEKVCPETFTWNRQSISKEDGDKFVALLEKSTGKKLDIPEDSSYSVTRSKSYSYLKRRDLNSILLFCEEKYGKRNKFTGDRTAIDIYI